MVMIVLTLVMMLGDDGGVKIEMLLIVTPKYLGIGFCIDFKTILSVKELVVYVRVDSKTGLAFTLNLTLRWLYSLRLYSISQNFIQILKFGAQHAENMSN